MTQNVNSNTPTAQASDVAPSSGKSGDVAERYAALQLSQSKIARNQAQVYMDKIKETQEKQREVSAMLNLARQQSGKGGTSMESSLAKYCSDRGIDIKTHNNLSKEDWDYNIKSIMNYQEQLGSTGQTDMVYLQDFMGQYDSYLQGANKTYNASGQTWQAILSR